MCNMLQLATTKCISVALKCIINKIPLISSSNITHKTFLKFMAYIHFIENNGMLGIWPKQFVNSHF